VSSLVFVRHGETNANRDGVLLGRLDPPLNDAGRAQAAAVAERLVKLAPARVLTSPLLRAHETAEIVAEPFGLDVVVDDRLIEIDYGEHDGALLSTLSPDLVHLWRTDADFTPEGGESLAAVGVRMADFTAQVLDSLADGPIVAVSHVSPIKAAVLWALDLSDVYAWRLRLDNGSVTRLAPGPDGPVLLSFNER
jgi:broad specificity phosphatase PhoE